MSGRVPGWLYFGDIENVTRIFLAQKCWGFLARRVYLILHACALQEKNVFLLVRLVTWGSMGVLAVREGSGSGGRDKVKKRLVIVMKKTMATIIQQRW